MSQWVSGGFVIRHWEAKHPLRSRKEPTDRHETCTNPLPEPFPLPKLSRTREAAAAAERCPLHPGGRLRPRGTNVCAGRAQGAPAPRGDGPARAAASDTDRAETQPQPPPLPAVKRLARRRFRKRRGWQRRGPMKQRRGFRGVTPAAAASLLESRRAGSRRGGSQGLCVLPPLPALPAPKERNLQ